MKVICVFNFFFPPYYRKVSPICMLMNMPHSADSSEASKTTDGVLSQRDVVEAMDGGRFVAIRLENGTEDTKQFSQICILLYIN